MSEVALTRALEALVMPLGLALAGGALALLLAAAGRHRAGAALGTLALLLLYAASIPATGQWLARLNEAGVRPLPPAGPLPAADAIVVLGAGRYADAPEYGGDTASRLALERLRYAARLHRRTGLPVLVTGGTPLPGEAVPEAVFLARVLREDFGVREVHAEAAARTTWENARNTARWLKARGWRRILLVTHAQHMRRALASYAGTGIEAIPAPTRFSTPTAMSKGPFRWLPSASALEGVTRHLHEILGRLWYRLRHDAAAGSVAAPHQSPGSG